MIRLTFKIGTKLERTLGILCSKELVGGFFFFFNTFASHPRLDIESIAE